MLKIKSIKKPVVGRQTDSQPRIRIDRESYLEIAEIASETGLSMRSVLSQLLTYALDRTEIVD